MNSSESAENGAKATSRSQDRGTLRENLSVASLKSNGVAEEAEGQEIGMREIDRFGIYQISIYTILSIPLILSAGFTLSYVFTSGEVKHRCLVPECEDLLDADINSPWVVKSAPFSNKVLETCSRYSVDENAKSDNCTDASFTNETKACDEWVYDPNESTIQNEWDIVCEENRWKLTLVGTMNNVGQFLGLIFAGYISDRYGRRTYLTLSTSLCGLSGLVHSFAVNYPMFVTFEFLDATIGAGIYSAGFILAMEMVGVKKRVLAGTITCCMFAVGEILLGLAAMWLKSWRSLLRMVYAPGLLAIFMPLLVPESVRWLLANGKHKQVEKIFHKMAHMNGMEISKEALSIFKNLNIAQPEKNDGTKGDGEGTEESQSRRKSPVTQVLNSPVILTRLLACSFCWLTNTFVYYGLSLNSVAFAGDKYTNFILVAIVEIPAYFFTWFLTDRVGRKPTLCGSFLLSGAFCLAIQFVPADTWTYAPLILYMSGKCCITMAFAAVYVYTAEMFPTNLRHSLLGICSMTGRIGSILAPQTPLLANIMESLPLILFGSMGLLAGVLSLVSFPETLGMKLPDTVAEAENIGRTRLMKANRDRIQPDRDTTST